MTERQDNVRLVKVKIPIVPPILFALCAALVLTLSPIRANAMDYAVQVAALSSQQCASELATGLRARGIDAYWVPDTQGPYGSYCRVRVGRFQTLENAYGYAERLLGTGLLEAYAIAAYEAPSAVMAKLDSLDKVAAVGAAAVNPLNRTALGPIVRRQGGEEIDLVARVGTRGWLLFSSQAVLAAQQQSPAQQTAMSRDLALLAASVGARGWTLRTNISSLFAPALPPSPETNLAGLAPLDVVAPTLSAPVIPVSAASLTPPPPAPPTARAAAVALAAPEIGRAPLSPTAPVNVTPTARRGSFVTPPRLEGIVELRNGRLWMKLRNLDAERSFTGQARVTLVNERNHEDIAPMQFVLAPDREESFPLDDATILDRDWVMMIYDDRGVARLVRGASFASRTPNASILGSASVANNATPTAPPSYVAGQVFDATITPPSAGAPMIQSANGQPGSDLVPVTGNEPASAIGTAASNAPPQLTVTPRQIAATTENVTMEFDIAGPQPLGFISVTLRAGDYVDTRQALMSSTRGRLPFMVPIAQAASAFTYEVRTEAGQVLSTGVGDFRILSRGN